MSEEIARTDLNRDPAWEDASDEEKAFWRKRVDEWAGQRRAEGIRSFRALEFIDPEKAAEVMFLLAAGLSIYKTGKKSGVAEILIRRTASHHLGPLEKWRPDLVQKLTRISFDLAEVIALKAQDMLDDPEERKKTPIDKLAVAFGIINDKNMAHLGQAAVVVEHRVGVSIDDARASIEAARARAAAKLKEAAMEAEVIDHA